MNDVKNNLLLASKNVFSKEDYCLLLKIVDFVELHSINNFPGSSEKEFDILSHLYETALVVINELKLEPSSVFATLLSRCTLTNFSIISHLVPETTFNFVNNLQKIIELDFIDVELKADFFRNLLINMSKDIRTVMIMCADRLVALREISSFPQDYAITLAKEAMFLYAPLAHRLGIYKIYSELSTNAFKITNKEDYNVISLSLNSIVNANNNFLNDFIASIKNALKDLPVTFDIKQRIKSPYSIWKKMQNQNIDIENIHDIFAIRVIFDSDFEKEKLLCWQIYATITDIYPPMISRTRDWVSIPRDNGYESLHTTVQSTNGTWVEVQIRSKRMDQIAEYGPAAHWQYKDKTKKTSLEKWLEEIRKELEDNKLSVGYILESMKPESLNNEIFVFTPTKQIKRFVKGATLLDFAYDIHSEIGNKCVGGIINNKNVEKSYKLQNGDTIFVRTTKTQKPSIEWLKLVNTQKAKYQIRKALNEEYLQLTEQGKEILKRKIKNWKYDFNTTLNDIIQHFGYKFGNDLYFDIAKEKINTQKIKNFLDNINSFSEEKKTVVKGKNNHNDIVLVSADDNTIIKGSAASCCQVKPEDNVFGFFTQNAEIKIHNKNCPNAPFLHNHFSYRILNLKWLNIKKLNNG